MTQPFRAAGLGLVALLALGACDKLKTGGAEVESAAATLGTDGCGAVNHQSLVGQSASVLNLDQLPAGTRVIFPGMPVTMDYREDRMNVEVGGGDKVARVFCG